MLTFSPERHEYRDGDTVVRSVTQILAGAGLVDDRWYTAESREMGSAVHDLCERYAQGERQDKSGRDLDALEYVNAFAEWMDKTAAYAVATECVIDARILGLRYAGKYDLLCEIDGRRVLVDIKTGGRAKWHPVQLAAYAYAVNPDRVMNLYVKPDGTYREAWLSARDLLDGLTRFKGAIVEFCR